MEASDEGTNWPDVGQVCHSLKRSRTRRMLYKALCEKYPSKMSLNELSALTWISPENVLGAMIGIDDRFSGDGSLVNMGLASCEEELIYGKFMKTFQATRHGIDMRTKLKEYRYRSEPQTGRLDSQKIK